MSRGQLRNSMLGGKNTNTRKQILRGWSNRLAQLERLESREMLTELLLTIENLSPPDGLFETPFWVGFHDGKFDLGTARKPADKFAGLEALAEEGDTSGGERPFRPRIRRR